MTAVILWRHGLTAWNAEKRFQGQTDIPLNEHGLAQAVEGARKLAELKPAFLATSDLSRASATAAALAEVTGLSVELDARLRERCFGEWETLTRAEIMQRFPASFARWRMGDPSPGNGIEPIGDLGKRVAEAIRQGAERADGQTAVLATHGAAIRWGIATLLGWPEEAAATLRVMGNCKWARLEFDTNRNGWVLAGYNLGA